MNYEEQIKELKEQIAKLEAKMKNKPQKDDAYYYVSDDGTVGIHFWRGDTVDDYLYLTQNCFKTREEAEEHKKEIETYFKFKNYVEEHSEPLDWTRDCQYKISCYYNFYANMIDYDNVCGLKNQGTIHASSERVLRDAIDYIGGEEVAKRYLFGIKE